MIIKNLLLASESYTHQNWIYRNINAGFSRLYYIVDGEAYYEENGKAVRFQKNHLYLTPVKRCFTIYENPEDKLMHTYSHITTIPEVTHFTEIRVIDGTPLADAVALWRKYIHSEDRELITNTIQFLLTRIPEQYYEKNTVAEQIKQYLDSLETNSLDMSTMSRALGYSREHMTRVFHAIYRATPKQYLNSNRMAFALERLCKGEKVKAVAEQLNFASPYSFSQAFKKYFGASPKQYLTMLKNEKATAEALSKDSGNKP